MTRRRSAPALFTLVCVFLVSGCNYGYPVSPIEAPGIYDASGSVGTEALQLRS